MLTIVPVQYDPAPLINGEVDGFIAHLTNESITVAASGVETTNLPFADNGLPFVAETVTVTEDAITNDREKLKAFLVAEIKGWAMAVNDPEAGAKLAVESYGKDLDLNIDNSIAGAIEQAEKLVTSDETVENGMAAPQQAAPPAADLSRDVRKAATRAVLRALGWSVLTFVLTLVAALGLWVGILWIFQISPLIAKGPIDVWNYFFTVPADEANRELIMGNVLFPALVNISFGLKSATPQMNDLVEVYGGGSWSKLNKVAMPSSSPAFFAAVRISVPGAITGALLAEWLAVGGGIGGSIGGFIPQAQFTALWASVVVVTAASLILYNVIQIVEDVVLARMGMHPQKSL